MEPSHSTDTKLHQQQEQEQQEHQEYHQQYQQQQPQHEQQPQKQRPSNQKRTQKILLCVTAVSMTTMLCFVPIVVLLALSVIDPCTAATIPDTDLDKLLEGIMNQAELDRILGDTIKNHDKTLETMKKLKENQDAILEKEEHDLQQLNDTIEHLDMRLKTLAFAKFFPNTVRVGNNDVYWSREAYYAMRSVLPAEADCHRIGGILAEIDFDDLKPVGDKIVEEGLAGEKFILGVVRHGFEFMSTKIWANGFNKENPDDDNRMIEGSFHYALYVPQETKHTFEISDLFWKRAHALCAVPVKDDVKTESE